MCYEDLREFKRLKYAQLYENNQKETKNSIVETTLIKESRIHLPKFGPKTDLLQD